MSDSESKRNPPQRASEGDIPAVAGSSVLGDLLDISGKTVREFAARGVMVRVGKGKYDIRASVRNYSAHMRRIATGRAGGESLAATAAAERARLAKAQADRIEMQNQRDRDELLDAGAVQEEWSGTLRGVRAGCLAVPSRAAARLPHLTQHDISEIDLEIRTVLTELGNGQGAAEQQ